MAECTTSFWNLSAEKTNYPRLENSLETEVLIIGSGITGITCAYCLAQKGLNPVVIEAGGLCDGTTGNTTGKVTIQHNIIYSNLVKKYGENAAAKYAESQNSALKFVREQVENHAIDCQLANNTAYAYASAESDLAAVEGEYKTAVMLGIEAELIQKPAFPKENYGMVGFKHQMVFHSVRYIEALAKAAVALGAKIHCDTKAIKLEDGDTKTVYCEHDITIKARHVVMATQYPFYDGPNIFFTRLYAKRSYGIAVSAKSDWPDGSYINISSPSRSIRTHVESGRRILIVAGESHFTGRGDQNMETHYENLLKFAESIAGVDELLAKWSAQDYETPDQIPYIGRVSDDSNLYVASGFGKWGLSNGTLAGNMIADLITTGSCRYEGLYSRTRRDFASSPGKMIHEVISPIVELVKSKLESTQSLEDLEQGEGRVISFNGQKAGIYRDFDDNVTVLDISCTHMSTELNFNCAEKTWDCPAHGGRFNVDGKLLEGPPKHALAVFYQGKYSDFTAKK